MGCVLVHTNRREHRHNTPDGKRVGGQHLTPGDRRKVYVDFLYAFVNMLSICRSTHTLGFYFGRGARVSFAVVPCVYSII